MKKCIVFLLLGGLLVSCKAESTTIAYTAISSVIIIGGFIGYVIAASTRIFITEADEILFRDLFKKENEETEEPPASSQASWETKNLLEFHSKRLFLRKSRHKEQISILKSPSTDLRYKAKKFFLFLSDSKKHNQFFLRFLDFWLRKLINLSIIHHNRLRNYPLFQKSSKKISKFSPIIRE